MKPTKTGSNAERVEPGTKKRIGNGWHLENDYSSRIDPEPILTTKFDSNGNPIAGTDC